MVETPISFHVFNRPRETAIVLESLRNAQPKTLIVHADGPRPKVSRDADDCREVRALIDTVDWDCEVIKNFSDDNLGSFTRNSSALNFVFQNFDEAIVLEDDCVPDPSFFRFCDELLDRYRNDTRISIIGGFSSIERRDFPHSYFFSRYTMSWGWASWRRMWDLVDLSMSAWPEVKAQGLSGVLTEWWIRREWVRTYDAIYEKRIKNGWDYQLLLSGWINNMVAVVPKVSLIENIGFGPHATHTRNATSGITKVKSAAIEFPLCHPRNVSRDVSADILIEKTNFERSMLTSLARQARGLLPRRNSRH